MRFVARVRSDVEVQPLQLRDLWYSRERHVNTKVTVIQRDDYVAGLYRWNDELKALAEICGFTPRLYRPYRANDAPLFQ